MAEYRTLGRSGLKVSPFCFGTMTFGDSQWKLGGVEQNTANRMVDICLNAGINFFDTADIYSYGMSETMLGKALHGKREQTVIATKARGRMADGPNDTGLSRKHLYDALHQSLSRLNTDYIDLYQVHGFDVDTPLEETLETLHRFVEEGKVRYIGLSNLAAWHIVKSQYLSRANGWTPFVSAQMHYSLVNRDIEHEVIPACLDQGLGIMAWSPLSGGFLSGKYRSGDAGKGTRFGDRDFWFPFFDRELGLKTLGPLEEIAREHNVSMSAIALAWLRDRPAVSTVIIGSRHINQLEDNIKGLSLTLTAEEITRLDELTKPASPYPQWMIERQTSG